MSGPVGNMQSKDMEMAELELLAQNQKRLASLTGRMTTILNGFDRRLVKLESSILPIHRSTQELSRISANVGLTQQELAKSLRHYGVVVDEEPIIVQGPNVRDPREFMEALVRVRKSLSAAGRRGMKEREQLSSKLYSLIELGGRKLAELVREYAAAESRPVDPAGILAQRSAWPGLSHDTMASNRALLQFLLSLPSGTSAETGFTTAVELYAEVRASYLKNSLAALSKHVSDTANAVQSVSVHGPREAVVVYTRGSARLGEWLQALVQMTQKEHELLSTLLKDLGQPGVLGRTLAAVVRPTLALVHSVLPTLLPRLQHGLNAHRLLVLDFLGASTEALGPDGQRWSALLRAMDGKNSELLDAVAGAQKDAFLFFPEFVRDVKVIPVQRNADSLDTGVSDIARLGTFLLRSLAEYQDVVLSLFQALGNRNWTASGTPLPAPAGSPAEVLYAEYATDLLASAVISLERSVTAVSQPTVSSIFLLNNLTYIRQEVLSASVLPSTAVPACDRLLNQALRNARTTYLESWNSVVSCLTDDVPGLTRQGSKLGPFGADRSANPRDAFTRFSEGLAEKERVHRLNPIMRIGGGLNESLRDDVVRLVCPLYSVFLAKQKGGLAKASRAPPLSERDVEARLGQLFL